MRKVDEIIRHVIAVCTMNAKFYRELNSGSREDPESRKCEDPCLYELRLVEEDDDDGYLPSFDIAALERAKPIGDFGTNEVAFCRIKTYHQTLKLLTESMCTIFTLV